MNDEDILSFDEFSENVSDSTSVKVPPERKVSFASSIGLVLSSFFFLLFLLSISQFSGLINAMILASFVIFGWDPIITSLFMAAIFLFLTVTIYLISRRGNEAVNKVEAGLKLMFNIPPTRYFDLSDVPTENIVRELVGTNNPRSNDKGRGCTMEGKGKGFTITCDTIPETDAMKALKNGELDRMNRTQQIIIISVFAGFGAMLAAFTVMGYLSGLSTWILWIVFLVAFFYVMIEMRVLKLWGVLVSWALINTFFTFIVSDMAFVWTMWGLFIAIGVIVAIFYLLSKDFCKRKESGICDFL